MYTYAHADPKNVVTVANATCLNFGSVMSFTRFPATPIARDGVDLMELEDVHSIGAGEQRLAHKIRPGCRSVNTNVLVFLRLAPTLLVRPAVKIQQKRPDEAAVRIARGGTKSNHEQRTKSFCLACTQVRGNTRTCPYVTTSGAQTEKRAGSLLPGSSIYNII